MRLEADGLEVTYVSIYKFGKVVRNKMVRISTDDSDLAPIIIGAGYCSRPTPNAMVSKKQLLTRMGSDERVANYVLVLAQVCF